MQLFFLENIITNSKEVFQRKIKKNIIWKFPFFYDIKCYEKKKSIIWNCNSISYHFICTKNYGIITIYYSVTINYIPYEFPV